MKITKSYLKQVIMEEMKHMEEVESQPVVIEIGKKVRVKGTKLQGTVEAAPNPNAVDAGIRTGFLVRINPRRAIRVEKEKLEVME